MSKVQRMLYPMLTSMLASCAGTFSPATPTAGLSMDRGIETNVLLPAEIDAAKAETAYDAIVKRRPGFLMSHRSDGSSVAVTRPSVVVDGGFPESIELLKSIQANEVLDIRFLEPLEATTKFGPQFTAGMIVVRLGHRTPGLFIEFFGSRPV